MPTSAPPDPTTDYARAVVAGEIVAGRLVRLACERHLRDLEAGPARGLRWDPAAADRAISFFGFLTLGDGSPFPLQRFQKFITGSLFGWKGPDNYRRFRTAYVEQAKGNGKTPWASGVLLYMLVADGEPEPECYCAAVSRDQANIAFRDAKNLAGSSPALTKILEIGAHSVVFPKRGGFLRAVSAEHRGLDGRRVAAAVLDEIHEHPTSLVVEKIRKGTKRRKQPLIVEITNSGYDRTTVCWDHHSYSVKVVEGLIEDDSWFAFVCSLDACDHCRAEGHDQPNEGCAACDHWDDEAVWVKANPGLDTILPRRYLRDQVREAKGMPASEALTKRLNFCIWTQAAVHAVPMDRWDACERTIDREALKGRECFAALDIGATSDFTAFALMFPHDDLELVEVPENSADPTGPKRRVPRRSFTILPWFWLPERPVKRDAHMGAVIDAWRRQGLIRTTAGDVVDYDQVLEDIVAIGADYPFRVIAVDRGFQGSQMCNNLMAHYGPGVHECPQGIITMNAPFREFVELVKLGRLHHDGNPVLRWMVSNCAAEQRGGLSKPSKDHSKEKIDIVTAAVMALREAMLTTPRGNYYESNELEMA
jgi:phage terminase large subunit-like protein